MVAEGLETDSVRDPEPTLSSKLKAADPLALLGPTGAWTLQARVLIALLVVAAFVLRVWALPAEGFADDEVHKWLAANRYLQLDFGGDDIEHPMLMKWLIAACILIGKPLGWAPETMV